MKHIPPAKYYNLTWEHINDWYKEVKNNPEYEDLPPFSLDTIIGVKILWSSEYKKVFFPEKYQEEVQYMAKQQQIMAQGYQAYKKVKQYRFIN